MKDGIIYKAALDDAKGVVLAALFFIGICIVILALSWKWVFNVMTGPAPLTGAMALEPGAREFVSVEGKLIPTPFSEQSALTIKGFKVGPASTTANYRMVMLEGRLLLVKVPVGFTGTRVEGTLTEPAKEIAEAVKAEPKWYPWVLVQSEYWKSMNLFVMIALVVLPFALLLLAFGLWRVAKPENCMALKGLKRFGPLEDTVCKIEDEIFANDGPGVVKPVTFTKTWVVVWTPSLDIFPKSEVVGYGIEEKVKETKEGSKTECVVHFWVKGKWDSVALKLSQTDAIRVVFFNCMQAIPDRMVNSVEEFKKSWHRRFLEDAFRERAEKNGQQT